MKIAEFLTKSYNEKELYAGYKIIEIRPRIVCADGFSISVQASENHYCLPRIDSSNGSIYDEVECGFPSEMEPISEPTEEDFQYYAEYAEDEDLTKTVYSYVPVSVVDKLLESHGGIDEKKTFAQKEKGNA